MTITIGTHLLVAAMEIGMFPHGVQQDTRCLTGSVRSVSRELPQKLSYNETHTRGNLCICEAHWPSVAGADADDLGEGALVDDGLDVLFVALAQIVQDVTQGRRHLRGQLGVAVVVRQHLHQLGQHLLHFRTAGFKNKEIFKRLLLRVWWSVKCDPGTDVGVQLLVARQVS